MNKRERFEAFLANKPVDRVPVALFHHFCEPDEWFKGLTCEEIFEKNIEGHRKAREVFDPDVVKIMNDSLMIMPIDVSRVKCASDLRNITAPAKDSAWMQKSKELTIRSMEIYKGTDAPIYVTSFSPTVILRTSLSGVDLGMAVERSLLHQFVEEDSDAVIASLATIADSVNTLNEILINECGADGIYFSVNNQGHYVPDDLYVKCCAPSDIKCLAYANSLSSINALHICGYHGMGNNLELFKNYDAAAINWAVHAEGVSLGEGKKLFAGKPVFGGFEQATVIYEGTRQDVEKETYQILDEAGQIGVMMGADCTVPNDIDEKRLGWVVEACEKYARAH